MFQSKSISRVKFDPALAIITFGAPYDQKVIRCRKSRYLGRSYQKALCTVVPGHDTPAVAVIDRVIKSVDSDRCSGPDRSDHLIVTLARFVPESNLIDGILRKL